jgi:CheY-like chemotaxis protein
MILIVDDHVDSRCVVMRMLRRFGYDVVEADGGQEAMDYLRDAKPELIILDCNMPCVDGLDVLRAVRGDARLADVPVVVFSADARDERREELEALGIQGRIIKGSTNWDLLAHFATLYAGPGKS